MNITGAMKLRNKLKSRIETLQSGVSNVDFGVDVDVDTKTKKWPALDGSTYEGALDEIDLTRAELSRLNLAIEEANAVNRLALNELHSLDSAVAWENSMLREARFFKEEKDDYEIKDGERIKVTKKQKPISTRDFAARLAALRKRRSELEDEISLANGTTEVDFVLAEGVTIY